MAPNNIVLSGTEERERQRPIPVVDAEVLAISAVLDRNTVGERNLIVREFAARNARECRVCMRRASAFISPRRAKKPFFLALEGYFSKPSNWRAKKSTGPKYRRGKRPGK